MKKGDIHTKSHVTNWRKECVENGPGVGVCKFAFPAGEPAQKVQYSKPEAECRNAGSTEHYSKGLSQRKQRRGKRLDSEYTINEKRDIRCPEKKDRCCDHFL